MHPQGMTSDKPRVKLTETPGNPAYALRQVYEVLMQIDDVEELHREVLDVLKPFNPLAALEVGKAALAAGVGLSDDLVGGVLEAADLRAHPTRKARKPSADGTKTVAVGMSADNYKRTLDVLQQIAWSDGWGDRSPVNKMKFYITNFLLAADNEGVIGGFKLAGLGYSSARPRYEGVGRSVDTGRRRSGNRFAAR